MHPRLRLLFILAVPCTVAGIHAADLQSTDLPKRKAGQWEVKIAQPGEAPQVAKLCLDEASDRALYSLGAKAMKGMCSKTDIAVQGKTVVADTVCTLPVVGTHVTSHGVTRFEGDTAYHTESTVRYEPALFGKTGGTSTSDGRWIGACAADQRPGDMIMPGGKKLNILDLAR